MMSVGLTILAGLFIVIVVPIWLVAHYLTRWRTARGLSREEEKLLGDLNATASRLETRIAALERILDAEAPDWRGRDEQTRTRA